VPDRVESRTQPCTVVGAATSRPTPGDSTHPSIVREGRPPPSAPPSRDRATFPGRSNVPA
jgi:hypothetical protein